MNIEIWSDFVCPFCYIGKRELEDAIESLGLQGKVSIQMKAYQLDPNASTDVDAPVIEGLAKKMNMTVEQALQATTSVVKRAKSVGLEYDFTKMLSANTKKAHQVAKYAEKNGKGNEFSEAILAAHFLNEQKLNDVEVLADIAEQLGLSRVEAMEAANSSELAYEVHQDIQEGIELGVRGVPFFVIDRKLGISGAQPQQFFQDTLRQAAEQAGIQVNF